MSKPDIRCGTCAFHQLMGPGSPFPPYCRYGEETPMPFWKRRAINKAIHDHDYMTGPDDGRDCETWATRW